MEFDLFSYTYENLNSLKFNDLQKLSARYHVNKRWAKKREIIDRLLLLRDQEILRKQPPTDSEKTVILQDNMEWVDGSKIFVTKDMDQEPEFVGNDRRLTYNVSTSDSRAAERRLTYKIDKGENLIPSEINYNFDRRLTYNANDTKYHHRELKYVSKNFTGIKNVEILKSSDTFKENACVTFKNKVNMKETETNVKSVSGILNSQGQSKGFTDSTSSKIKMLTEPCKRISNHNNAKIKVKDLKSNATKISENPFTTKNSSIQLTVNIKTTPVLQQVNFCGVPKDNGIIKSSGIETNTLNISEKSSDNSDINIKNEILKPHTISNVIPRRKSKTEDNVLVKNLKPSKNLKFYSPKESEMKSLKFSKPFNTLDLKMTCRSKIPKAKPAITTQKPITATKMPDFSKIHQRRFEQMDSLIDYKRKKEERAKKLFGFPQPGIPGKASTNDMNKVFQFKSSNKEKESRITKSLKKDIVNNITGNKEKSFRKDVLSRAGSKPDIVMNLKELNRKHLHGVRTNKRFELQMKSRKL